MDIEFEATFTNIDKDKIRTKLNQLVAKLIKKEFLQKRVVFNLPKGNEISGGWLRVRDEGDKITMSLKVIDGNEIHDQKEIYLKINDFNTAISFLESMGCRKKAFQENKREVWELNGVEICIDEWPFLEPFVEVEGPSEKKVKEVSELLGFDYSTALFCAVGTLYNLKYHIPEDIINDQTPEILFDMKNPFNLK